MYNQINIYYFHAPDWSIPPFGNYLSAEEWEEFKEIKHRQTFGQKVVSRGLLKHVLCQYYGVDKENVILERNDRGKPFLKNQPDLCFNSSHSQNMILIGVTENDRIGIDIEYIQTLPDADQIAERFFSKKEWIQYEAYKRENDHAFFMFWTAKEAIIKAYGKSSLGS